MCKEGADCGKALDGRIFILDAAEMSRLRQGIIWSRGLIQQLPADHEGRNSWLLNFGAVKDDENKVPLADFGKPDVTAGRVGTRTTHADEFSGIDPGYTLGHHRDKPEPGIISRFGTPSGVPSGDHGQKLEPVKVSPSIADERAALAAEREKLTSDVFESLSELDAAAAQLQLDKKALAAQLVASIESLLWPKPAATFVKFSSLVPDPAPVKVSAEPLQPAQEGFSIGDVVMLRSGGTLMTVINQRGAGRVACAWFNSADERLAQDFPSGALKAK